MQHDADDDKQHAHRGHGPADEPGGNAVDGAPERVGESTPARGSGATAGLLEEAKDARGEQTEADHKGQQTRPEEPPGLGFRRGDLAEEALPLLNNVLDVRVVRLSPDVVDDLAALLANVVMR